MLQLNYQNNLEDLKAYAEYMAGTVEQRAWGRSRVWLMVHLCVGYAALFAFLVSIGFESKVAALLVFAGLFTFELAVMLLRVGLQPAHYFARQPYLEQIKKLTPRQRENQNLPRTLSADAEKLEFGSPLGFRRCRWECVEKIGLTSDFIFIHINGCPVYFIPKRAFPSEEAFKEFGRSFTKLWEVHHADTLIQAAS